jgi:hypothetical protein
MPYDIQEPNGRISAIHDQAMIVDIIPQDNLARNQLGVSIGSYAQDLPGS